MNYRAFARAASAISVGIGLGLASLTAQAATITYNYSGTLRSVSDAYPYEHITNVYSAGDAFSGTLTFNIDGVTDLAASDPNVGSYAITGSNSFTHASGTIVNDDLHLGIRFQNPVPGADEQFFSFNLLSTEGYEVDGQTMSNRGHLGFFTSLGNALVDDSFEQALDITLEDWEFAEINLDFVFGPMPFYGDDTGRLYGDITEWNRVIDSVPAPNAIGLLLVGAGLSLTARRRSRRNSAPTS